jgi:hypothetical protein
MGTILLTDVIVAHDILQEIFPCPGGEEYRNTLIRILNELPPEPHKPPPTTKTPFKGFLFSFTNDYLLKEIPINSHEYCSCNIRNIML